MKRALLILTILSVGSAALAQVGATYGKGSIKVSDTSVGVFSFEVYSMPMAIKGYLNHIESGLATTNRGHRVSLTSVDKFACTAHNAAFAGFGVFDGQKARVEVNVYDGGSSASARADTFTIVVYSVDSATKVLYKAGGPLASGDIVVRCLATSVGG